VVTIEISSTEIRLMEVTGGRVIKWASRSLEAGMFEEGVISDPQALGAVVKQLMASSDIKGMNVTASVSGLYSLSRIVMVPTPLGGSATQLGVLEAMQEVMPFSEDELYFSWQTITTIEGGQQVLVVGVPRDVIDNEVQALRTVGINPHILDLKDMALIRAVNREQALILNIEPSSFDVVIVANGLAEIMRTTAWQEGDLSVEGKAEHLALALELTVGFYNSHHPGLPLDPATPLFITGPMSSNLTLIEKLQARAGYPFEPLTPPLQYPALLPVSQYAVNIGLALKGTAASKNLGQAGYVPLDVNLLPEVYRPWKPSAKQIYAFLVILTAVAVLFPLFQVTTEAMDKTAALETRYTQLNNMLTLRQVEIKNREPLQKTINEYNTIVGMGGGFTEGLEVIRSEADKLGVQVQSITQVGNSITLVCQADSYIAFRRYLTALEESGGFSTPIPPPEGYPYTKEGIIKLEPKPSE